MSVFFGEIPIYIFCSFFNQVVWVFWYKATWGNCLLRRLIPVSLFNLPMCSPVLWVVFSFIYGFICRAEVLSWIRSHWFIFIFITLGGRSKKDTATVYVRECSVYVFLLELYSIWSYAYVFNVFRVYFCVWCQRMFSYHSFTCSCLVFPAPLIKEIIFFPLFSPPFVID